MLHYRPRRIPIATETLLLVILVLKKTTAVPGLTVVATTIETETGTTEIIITTEIIGTIVQRRNDTSLLLVLATHLLGRVILPQKEMTT